MKAKDFKPMTPIGHALKDIALAHERIVATATPSSPLIPLDEVVRVVGEQPRMTIHESWAVMDDPEGNLIHFEQLLTAIKELGK